MKHLIAINYVNYQSEIKSKLQDVALNVLVKNRPLSSQLVSLNFEDEKVNVPEGFDIWPILKNDAQKKIGNSRRLPYIKEIFNTCSNVSCDFFGYMNSDILVKKDFFDVFNDDCDAYIFYKKDIKETNTDSFLKGDIKVVSEFPYGIDAFFFRREWWIDNMNLFPEELVSGETEWDTCYNSIIQGNCKNYTIKRSLYHVKHERTWTIDSRAAINNMLIWRQVREKYGLPKFTPETRQQ